MKTNFKIPLTPFGPQEFGGTSGMIGDGGTFGLKGVHEGRVGGINGTRDLPIRSGQQMRTFQSLV